MPRAARAGHAGPGELARAGFPGLSSLPALRSKGTGTGAPSTQALADGAPVSLSGRFPLPQSRVLE